MDKFVVEADGKVVGIAVRSTGGFRFVSSDPDFHPMDSKVFPHARTLVSRVAEFARAAGQSPDRSLARLWMSVAAFPWEHRSPSKR